MIACCNCSKSFDSRANRVDQVFGDVECPYCGTEQNASGQSLAPRSQWGEETGESLSDIYNPDPNYDY